MWGDSRILKVSDAINCVTYFQVKIIVLYNAMCLHWGNVQFPYEQPTIHNLTGALQ